VLWERWTRCAMGLRPSRYQVCQGMMWALEIILGDHDDPRNGFHYKNICQNLPGKRNYDQCRAWVYKVREDGVMATDFHVYVDDLRTTGPTETECWEASQRVSSVFASLGIQNFAGKKVCRSGWGAWKGSVVQTSMKKVVVLATVDKWKKLKELLGWLWTHYLDNEGINHKLLEQKRGFLVHMVQTYPALNPYLKGFHGTLDSWRKIEMKMGFVCSITGKSQGLWKKNKTQWQAPLLRSSTRRRHLGIMKAEEQLHG
jgi:hypothetical protein